MNIYLESLLNGSAAGHLEMNLSSSETIDSLISTFCIEKGIRYKRQFVVKNQQNEVLDSAKTLAASGVQSGDILYLTSKNEEQTLFGFNNWWILFGVSTSIGLIGLIVVTFIFITSGTTPPSYGIVFDAGSTHTRMVLYLWKAPKDHGTGLVHQLTGCNVEGGGISSYASRPEDAGKSLEKCLKTAHGKIPNEEKKTSPVYLGATAGMRLLNQTNQTEALAIMASINKTLSQSGFEFKTNQSRIISGQEEGLFGWITTNYLFDRLGNSHNVQDTLGAMDLGGASTQISFITNNSTRYHDHVVSLELFGMEYNVFSRSYLCYGQREIQRRYRALLILNSNASLVDDPCSLRNAETKVSLDSVFNQTCTKPLTYHSTNKNIMLRGTANLTACNALMSDLVNSTECKKNNFTYCINGSEIPRFDGNFVAFSAYFYILDYFLNTTSNLSLHEFRQNLQNKCDGRNFSLETKSIPRIIEPWFKDNNDYCMSGSYVLSLFIHVYKLDTESKWNRVRIADQMKNIDLGWSLGFMTNATRAIEFGLTSKWLSVASYVALLILFVVFITLGIAFARHACRHQFGRKATSTYQRLSQYGAI